MNSQILEEASQAEPDIPVLINMISKRIRQLNAGSRPLIEVHPRMGLADIALAEVAAGKLKIAPNHSENSEEF